MDDCHSDVSILGKLIVDCLARRWVLLVFLLLLALLDDHLFCLRKVEAFVDVLCIDEEPKLEGVEIVRPALELKGVGLDGIEHEVSEACEGFGARDGEDSGIGEPFAGLCGVVDEDLNGLFRNSSVESIQLKDKDAVFISWQGGCQITFSIYPSIVLDDVSDIAAIAAEQESFESFPFFFGQKGHNLLVILRQFKQLIFFWPLYH